MAAVLVQLDPGGPADSAAWPGDVRSVDVLSNAAVVLDLAGGALYEFGKPRLGGRDRMSPWWPSAWRSPQALALCRGIERAALSTTGPGSG